MRFQFLSRAFSIAAVAVAGLLAGCGSSNINDPFRPTRVIVFGDSFSVISATNAYTVNSDGSTNNWASQVAARYGVGTVVPLAVGNATVDQVQAQVNAFGANYQSGDLVLVSAGFRDIINEAAGSNSTSTVAAKGNAYAEVIRSIVANGAKHVVPMNVYDLSKTPAAAIVTNLGLATNNRGNLTAAFNDALKTNLGNTAKPVGDYVRLVDAEAYLNLVRYNPGGYLFSDISTIACETRNNGVDPDNGLGLGVNQVNSFKCSASTLNPAANSTAYRSNKYDNYVFADAIYPTPAYHRSWGSTVYTQLIARW